LNGVPCLIHKLNLLRALHMKPRRNVLRGQRRRGIGRSTVRAIDNSHTMDLFDPVN